MMYRKCLVNTVRKRYDRLFNLPQVRTGNNVMEYDVSGWSYRDVTRSGKLAAWALTSVVDVDWAMLVSHGNYPKDEFDPTIINKHIPLLGRQVATFFPAFHQVASLYFPMTVRRYLDHISHHSYTVLSDVRAKDTRTLLARIERKIVYVNPAKGKAAPLPDVLLRIRDKLQQQQHEVQPNLEMDKHELDPSQPEPEHAFAYNVRVNHSDLDIVYLATNSAYHMYCMDAAAEASLSGFLQHFPVDVAEYNLHVTSAMHSGRSMAGDELRVTLWENPSVVRSLFFNVRKGKRVIFSMGTKFYPLDD